MIAEGCPMVRRAQNVRPLSSDGIYELPSDYVPPGVLTLGRLVAEALRLNGIERQKTREEVEETERLDHHADLYARWCRMALRDKGRLYPPEHPIHANMVVWELYVCRLDAADAAVANWFAANSPLARLNLCDLSREIRRKGIIFGKSDDALENLNDTASYSTLLNRG